MSIKIPIIVFTNKKKCVWGYASRLMRAESRRYQIKSVSTSDPLRGSGIGAHGLISPSCASYRFALLACMVFSMIRRLRRLAVWGGCVGYSLLAMKERIGAAVPSGFSLM